MTNERTTKGYRCWFLRQSRITYGVRKGHYTWRSLSGAARAGEHSTRDFGSVAARVSSPYPGSSPRPENYSAVEVVAAGDSACTRGLRRCPPPEDRHQGGPLCDMKRALSGLAKTNVQ